VVNYYCHAEGFDEIPGHSSLRTRLELRGHAESIDAGRIVDARIALVISNKADSPGIDTARQRGLNALVIRRRARRAKSTIARLLPR